MKLTTLGAILWLGRPFSTWIEAQKPHAGEPIHYDLAPRDLAGQIMVISGTGDIGARIARYVRGIDVRLIGMQRSPPLPDQPFEEIHHPSKLHELLPRAGWLTVACTLTDETRGMIDERTLAALPSGPRLIYIARGAIVDEAAMIAAFRSGQLGGAYLEAFAQEPLSTESPLWDFPNVLITPHNAAISWSYPLRSPELSSPISSGGVGARRSRASSATALPAPATFSKPLRGPHGRGRAVAGCGDQQLR